MEFDKTIILRTHEDPFCCFVLATFPQGRDRMCEPMREWSEQNDRAMEKFQRILIQFQSCPKSFVSWPIIHVLKSLSGAGIISGCTCHLKGVFDKYQETLMGAG